MKRKGIRVIAETIVIFTLVCIVGGMYYRSWYQDYKSNQIKAQQKKPESITTTADVSSGQAVMTAPEDNVYSYFQGPKAMKKKLAWSGYWGKKMIDGANFGAYGCGACCLANVYSTLSPYECTPVDAYEHVKDATEYGGGGAIEWAYMKKALTSMGMANDIEKKPKTYEEFQQQIANAECAIVLVTCYEKNSYWKDTPGHYVTIFQYNREKDKVFLTDSGNIEHNRTWVSLKDIYNSLKTVSKWQYIRVYQYQEQLNEWKHTKANGKWIRP